MSDIVDKIIQKMCDCIYENDECKEEGCDKCINGFAKKVVEYSDVD